MEPRVTSQSFSQQVLLTFQLMKFGAGQKKAMNCSTFVGPQNGDSDLNSPDGKNNEHDVCS